MGPDRYPLQQDLLSSNTPRKGPSRRHWHGHPKHMSQEEVLHDESEGDVPSFTELEHAAPSQHDYNMSFQSGTSSQYYSHEGSLLPSEEDLSEDELAVFGGAVQLCLD